MKKYLILINTILIITSCDVEERPFITDYNAYINPEKKVLIEDFTGHLCPNCPGAAEELKAIQDIYPNQNSYRVVDRQSLHHSFIEKFGILYSTSANITKESFNKEYAFQQL